MKRLWNSLLGIFLVLTMFTISGQQTVYASGDVNTSNFSFEASTGTLTIKTNLAINGKMTSNAVYNWNYSNSGINVEDVIHVVINDGVTKIGDEAFSLSSNIKTVIIPESVTSIGSSAFFNCTSLEQVELPSHLDTIKRSTFKECTSLETVIIPESVKVIEESAFYNCSALKQITLPSEMTTLGESAFAGSGLTSIDIPAKLTTLGKYVFTNCNDLVSATFNEGLTVINNSMFSYCARLSSVTIPESVKTINSAVFMDCPSLKEVKLPSELTELGSMAFYNSGLTSIELPEKLELINRYAFHSCDDLTTITLPASIKDIGASVFFNSGITTVYMEGTVPSTIHNEAFKGLPEGYKIYVPDGVIDDYKNAQNWSNLKDNLFGLKIVSFVSLNANGTSNTETTTKLTLSFDKDIEGLSVDDITLTGATKGTLTKLSETGKYELTISDITVKDNEEATVVVNKAGFIFTPVTMKTKVFVKDTTITPPSYEVLIGADSVWKSDSSDELLFKIDAKYIDFKSIKVDGKEVDNSQYTSREGSTIVTLKPEYLSKLSVGKHILTVVFKDKDVSIYFNIEKAQEPTLKPDDKPDTKPDTKPETKPDTKPETKPETKPDTKPEIKPETKPDTKPEVDSSPNVKVPETNGSGSGKELDPNVPNTSVETNKQDFIYVLLGAMGIIGICGYKKKKLEK